MRQVQYSFSRIIDFQRSGLRAVKGWRRVERQPWSRWARASNWVRRGLERTGVRV